MLEEKKLRLDFGCGMKPQEGFEGVDVKTVVTAKCNEVVDTTMLKYSLVLEREIDRIGWRGIIDDANPEGCDPGSRSRHAETK